MIQECRKHMQALTIYGTNKEQIRYVATDGIMYNLPSDIKTQLSTLALAKLGKTLLSLQIDELLGIMESWAQSISDIHKQPQRPGRQDEGKDKKISYPPKQGTNPRTTLATGQQNFPNRSFNQNNAQCILCQKKGHSSLRCPEFDTPEKKFQLFKDKNMCFRCAEPNNHIARDCAKTKQCTLKNSRGETCGKYHNYLLHDYMGKYGYSKTASRPARPQPQAQKSGSGTEYQKRQPGNGSRPL